MSYVVEGEHSVGSGALSRTQELGHQSDDTEEDTEL